MADATARIGSREPGHHGRAGSGVTLGVTPVALAWNLQGRADNTALVTAATRRFGAAPPATPNTWVQSQANGVAWRNYWLGPRSWLMVASRLAHAAMPAYAATRDAINLAGGALFDVSASRVAFAVRGPQATTVLAKSCPLDFHPRVFAPGQCAQSVLGHVNALFCHVDATQGYTVMVARSLADDAWRTLCVSAAQYGYDVVGDA